MRISDWSSDVCASDLQLINGLALKSAAEEDHPRTAEEAAHHREIEVGAAETVQHWQVVFIGETAGRRAVDIGLVGEKDRGRMFAQDRTPPGKLGGVALHRGGITAEQHPVESRPQENGKAPGREGVC